ncbi:MAG: putative helicase [Myxococcaceae bacterium]|nr:putative helicase [Myxococcaceae bacterium]
MRVVLESTATFCAGVAPPELVEALAKAMSVANPRHVSAVERGRDPGREPRTLCLLEQQGGTVSIPRGATNVLRRLAADQNIELTFEDRRQSGEPLECVHARELRDYQSRAVDILLKRQQCIAIAPAGAGKTTIALGCVARAQTSTLIIADKYDLVTQWRNEVRAQLGVEAGVVGAGQHEVRPITVALVPTLAQMDDGELAEFLAGFGVLICDEVHHAASPTWSRVINASPARYRWGFTATQQREDTLTPTLEWVVGPFGEIVGHADLLESGALIAPTIISLRSDFRFEYRSPADWPGLLDALVVDGERNDLIVNRVVADAGGGHLTLVLTGRVSHAEALATAIAKHGITAAALTGHTPKKQRAQLLAQAQAGELSVLVATSLADEGLDLPRLSRVYLVFPARAAGRVEQRIGRVMRPHPDKLHPAVIDVVDGHVGVLSHQARKRAAVFAEILGT